MKLLKKETTISVLLSDSSASAYLPLLDWLENSGYGIEMLTEADLDKDDPDRRLIIADLDSARRHGKALLSLKKDREPYFFPLLLASAPATQPDAWLEAGFDDVIGVPFDEKDLATRLEIYLRIYRHSQASLAESAERINTTFDMAPIGIVHTDTEGRLLFANRHFSGLLGYAKRELSGMKMEQLMHPDDVAHIRSGIDDLLAGRVPVLRQVDKRYRRRNGTIIWTTATIALVRDVHGKPKYVIGIVEDITERRGLEAALRESERFARSIVDALSRHTEMGDEQEIAQAVRATAREGVYPYPQMPKQLIQDFPSADPDIAKDTMTPDPPAAPTSLGEVPLTMRQCEVLRNIAQGYGTKQIAHRLGISPKTVEAHRTHLMERLGIHDIPSLVRYAIRMGLISADK